MSGGPATSVEYTIDLPSGDQFCWPAQFASGVSAVAPLPSTAETQIRLLPSWLAR